jgi:hypothetical protein
MMSLDKKQKKHIDAARKKLMHLQQLLSAAKKQMDDPADVTRLKLEIAAVEEQIRKFQHGT